MTEAGQRVSESLARMVVIWATILSLGMATGAGAQNLTKRLDARLDRPPFNRQLWGVALLNEDGKLLYGRNADRMFMPASNTKIIVSTVAAALLPPDSTVRTSVYAAGPVIDGVIRGDLVLYGRGDPTMGRRCYAVDTTVAGACDTDPFARLRVLADTLRARGIRTVAGDVVGDGSYFEGMLVHPEWESYDLNWWYAAPVAALGFNDNSVDIAYAPGAAEGVPARLSMTPDFGNLFLENRTRTGPAGSRASIDFFRVTGTERLWAEGEVPVSSRGGTEYFAVSDPNLFTAVALRSVLAEAGIAVLGTTRSTTDSMLFASARLAAPLAEVESRPFRDWIFPVLNTSQNWFAEMLLKQLGRRFGKAGSWEEGRLVERRFLIDSVGIDSMQFAISDGSGLSSSNLVSPATFAKLLQFIHHHPRYPTFAAGLPQSGQTGSLRTRFVGTALDGRVRAKTGSINRVNTLSGFIEQPKRILTFSIEANHHTMGSRGMIPQIDSLVLEMGRK
jgi:serine-type D-Ala-D-Ala carboxypeptidase/endopeptidase (penicillin-binding protein 4)